MNDPTKPAATDAAQHVDASNPWLGLASFTEETRGFFYGREEEVAELCRRVQRKLLTILFGQSGLGKTSILRAGLVPRLRGQGYCPVYVRIDYGRDAPEPADQIKQAIAATAQRSGEWSQAGVAVAGESLWEFLHHRDDVLRDEAGNTLIPLLIFDQFEEIFTLAQTDDFGRARAARFVADLADLVENRPPKALEERFETDDTAAEQFDFARSDYRVLISLREDYLAPLEGLKSQMPSITQNRLRLAPMTGTQALEAVMKPGGKLVTEEVAAAIVRFVAGGAELANAEVEPSLLSLICRELNDKRRADGRAEISLDLLAGSHATILSEFYERALIDQPPAVRRIIEDELLTESGYRENVAEERLVSSFSAAGAAPGTLATLVNRRLLRIEERLDVRRVELTHDVLCGVVKTSRDVRQERESRDATERLLAAQRDRELAARAALVRARRIAAVCIALALGALVAAGFAYMSTQRARRAEQEARETRAEAEQARTKAEQLVSYLNADFANELEGFGSQTLVTKLGRKELDYFQSLPPSLQSTETIKHAALAQARYGISLQKQYDLDGAAHELDQAITALGKLRKAGDTSEGTAIGLGLALSSLADVLDRTNRVGGKATGSVDVANEQAESLLRPYAYTANASPDVRRAYAKVAWSAATYLEADQSEAMFERAKKMFESLGALDLSDIYAAADYADLLSYQAVSYGRMGRDAEVEKLSAQAVALADRVLARRPGHLIALEAKLWGASLPSWPAGDDMQLEKAISMLDAAQSAGRQLLIIDPTNADARSRASLLIRNMGLWSRRAGKLSKAIAYYRQDIDLLKDAPRLDGATKAELGITHLAIASIVSDLGDRKAGDAEVAAAHEMLDAMRAEKSGASALSTCYDARAFAAISVQQGDLATARARLEPTLQVVHAAVANDVQARRSRAQCTAGIALTLSDIANREGRYAEAMGIAAEGATAALALKGWDPDYQRTHSALVVEHAVAAAQAGRPGDALVGVHAALDYLGPREARNREDNDQHFLYAKLLYAQALIEPATRTANLTRAADIVAKLPAEMHGLRSVAFWAERIRAG